MEGSNWEAAAFSSRYGLNNLIAVLDLNKQGQSTWTSLGSSEVWNETIYKQRFEGFGWDVTIVDGHDVEQIAAACLIARHSSKPFIIIAKTNKGEHTTVSNQLNWHGKPLDAENFKKSIEILETQVDHSIPNVLKNFQSQQIRHIGPHVHLDVTQA